MADGYRKRLERDLDGWIAAGLVPARSREPILQGLPRDRRLDPAAVLAIVGLLLAAAAAVAFVADNWGAIPRLVRFLMILAVFAGAGLGAAWAARARRPALKDALLCVAAIVFAAAVGLTGQIFDIAGDARGALHMAGLAALLLALAGDSPWPAAAGLLFIGAGDFNGAPPAPFGWLVVAAPAGAALALRWRSAALAHAAGIGLWAAGVDYAGAFTSGARIHWLVLSAIAVLLAAGVRVLREPAPQAAGALYGWMIWAALAYFGASAVGRGDFAAAYACAWLVFSVAVIVLGRHDRHGLVTAGGVVSLFAAGAALLFDLGVNLLTAAAIFAGCAITALIVAAVLKRSEAAR